MAGQAHQATLLPDCTENPNAQDVNVVVCEADAGAAQAVALGRGRQAYLVAIEGSVEMQRRAGGGSDAGASHAATGTSGQPAEEQCEPEGGKAGGGAHNGSSAGAPADTLAVLGARDAAELVAPRDAELPLLLVPGALGAHFMLVEMARP